MLDQSKISLYPGIKIFIMIQKIALVFIYSWIFLFRSIKGSALSTSDNIFIDFQITEDEQLMYQNWLDELATEDLNDSNHCRLDNFTSSSVASESSDNYSVSPLIFAELETLKTREKLIRRKLREIFQKQFPILTYNLCFNYIENWPEDVDLYKAHWNKEELEKINERLPLFKFHPRKQPLPMSERFDLYKLKCLTEAELDTSLTKLKVRKLISERFQFETGLSGSKIDWNLLDRTSIPTKYNQIRFNSKTIDDRLIRFNREIIDNIHFYPAGTNRLVRNEKLIRRKKQKLSNHASADIDIFDPLLNDRRFEEIVEESNDQGAILRDFNGEYVNYNNNIAAC